MHIQFSYYIITTMYNEHYTHSQDTRNNVPYISIYILDTDRDREEKRDRDGDGAK